MLATVGALGFIPLAPGFMGSLAGVGIAYLLRAHPAGSAAALAAGCALAVRAIPATERYFKREDSPHIVIDETLGMLLALWMVPWHGSVVIAGFILFRALDVLKPLGIRRLEAWPSPWGVLADDLACGLVVNVALQVVMRGLVR